MSFSATTYSLSLATIILFATLGFAQSIKEPTEPTVRDVSVADVTISAVSSAPMQTNQKSIVMVEALLTFSGGKSARGIIRFEDSQLFVLTNRIGREVTIRGVTVFNTERIKILKWRADWIEDRLYRFTPIHYQIYTNSNSYIEYKGNVGILNRLDIVENEVRKTYYSIFFDYWIEGKKGVFRWENSKVANFAFNNDNALVGTVIDIVWLNR